MMLGVRLYTLISNFKTVSSATVNYLRIQLTFKHAINTVCLPKPNNRVLCYVESRWSLPPFSSTLSQHLTLSPSLVRYRQHRRVKKEVLGLSWGSRRKERVRGNQRLSGLDILVLVSAIFINLKIGEYDCEYDCIR